MGVFPLKVDFGIDFSIYHRTSDKLHHETAQEFFKTLEDKNVFTEKTAEQFYDEENNQFLADRYISGECPKCNASGAYGDQCEKCGSANAFLLMSWYLSTISCGDTPSFLARKVIAAPCSSDPQIKATSCPLPLKYLT